MHKSTKLLVQFYKAASPRLTILSDSGLPPNSSLEFRVSPIFAAFSDTDFQFIPQEKESYKVLFLFPNLPFSTLGYLDQQFGTSTVTNNHDVLIKSCVWVSHGLASIIIISNDVPSIEKILELTTVPDGTINAWELWDVDIYGNITTTFDLLTSHTTILAPITFKHWDFHDKDIREIIEECTYGVNILLGRVTKYSPSQIDKIHNIFENIKSLIALLKKLDTDDNEGLDKNLLTLLEKDSVFKMEYQHRVISELIEYNSIISYSISQGFSGHVPILGNESQIRHHSLLGIGTSYKALVNLYDFVSSAFQKRSTNKVFELFNGFSVNDITLEHSCDPDQWPSVNFKNFENLEQQNKQHVVYFSARSGYRETLHAIICAMQVLSSADSVRWSLLVNTHEYMHAVVRSILSYVFPADHLKNKDKIDLILKKYRIFLKGKGLISKLNVRDFLQSICVHYLHLVGIKQDGKNAFNQYKIHAKRAMDGTGNISGQEVSDNGTYGIDNNLYIPVINIDNFKTKLSEEWLDLNEIMTHAFDFIYFYDSNPKSYVSAIWLSWATVPSAHEQIDEYLLRTISIVSMVDKTPDRFRKFENAYNIVKSELEELSETSESPIVKRALKIFTCSETQRLMNQCLLANVYLVEMVRKYFSSDRIQKELDKTDNSCSISGFTAGQYDLKDINNPVYFIKHRLINRIQSGELSEEEELFSSLWMMLTCSSITS